MANEAAGAAGEATKAVLDLSLKMGEYAASIKIDNVWLAAGSVAAALAVGAFYIHRKYPAQRAIRNALETEEAGVVDPEVRGIEAGSIVVDLVCHTEQTFLSFMDDFEAKRIKLRLEEEFRKIGYEEELEVTITNLDEVYQKLNHIRAMKIRLETSDQNQGKYPEAKELYDRAIDIIRKIGDRKPEEYVHRKQPIDEYAKAEEYLKRALGITKEIGDKNGEASAYGNLGIVFQSVGEYAKAKEYLENALAVTSEIGDRKGVASAYGNLGIVFQSVGEYAKATEYLERALLITKEIGDRSREASAYGNLGNLFHSVGENDKALEYLNYALVISKEIDDRKGEASAHANLGTVFQSTGEYAKAVEYLDTAYAARKEFGDRKGEASSLANLGTVFQCLGECAKAKEYLQRALEITKEIGDRNGEASAYGNLGTVFESSGDNMKAEDYYLRGLQICKDIGDVEKEFHCLFNLAWLKFVGGNMQTSLSYLNDSINKLEVIRSLLGDNDELKISFLHERDFSYWMLSVLLFAFGQVMKALYVLELGRARALADLLLSLYGVESQICADPQSWIGIDNIMKKERNCTCIYFSSSPNHIFFWVLKTSGDICFREKDVNLSKWLIPVSSSGTSIFPQLPLEDNHAVLHRLVEEEDEEITIGGITPTLGQCYELMIEPVVDLLEEPEIIIVPDRALYKIPFSALHNRSGKYLSENFRIRIIPSLMTLKLIQDSPVDYHSQTGTLIVGDPDVGEVLLEGCVQIFPPSPGARKEAEMIGHLLGTEPLLRGNATKQAVLQSIQSVSLIHFAGQGSAEELCLAPLRPTSGHPHKEDFVLTMSEISKFQLRAKLVVLSCCHRAHGQIGPEGVNGIARAFLGAGARSVLVSQWAIEDAATEQLMSCFYEHLVHGESTSESLHQAMKWMRENGYSDVRKWAPFVLIGDNVTFDFGDKASSDKDVTPKALV